MIYKTLDGELIRGNSPLEIVENLRNGSRFASNQTIYEYMNGFAEREKTYSGKEVRVDLVDNFVEDLVSAEFMKRVL